MVVENTRHGNRRPRTPGAGNREHPVWEAENTQHGNRRPRTPGAGDREQPGQGSREHPAREQEAENARRRKPRTPGQGSREFPALVGALKTSGAQTRVPFDHCGAPFIPEFREYFPPPFNNSEPAAPRSCIPKCIKKRMESPKH